MTTYPLSHGETDRLPRVVLTDHPWPDLDLERSIIETAGYRLVAGPETAGTTEEVEALVQGNDPVAILTCWADVSTKAVDSPSDLRIVARLGVGLDNIAVTAATQRGAWVSNVPDYCVSEVSDHAIGLILTHYRGIARLDAATKQHGWNPDGIGLERISDLTVGIVGYGRIGRETARKLRAFGCRVLAQSPDFTVSDDHATAVALDAIQREADVIVLHVPLLPTTRKLVDMGFLEACSKRPLLVNVSRGGLIDNDALLAALSSGQIRGAALDVMDGEPTPPADIYNRADVIVTPHIAFASTASMKELRRRACEEVVRVLKGEAPLHPCNAPLQGKPLDGGVASDIRVIDGPDGPVVVKKALAKLRVAADWFSDPARSATEVAAIDAFAQLVGEENVPTILWTKPDDHMFAMALVDPRFRNWKQSLLSGEVDDRTAHRAGGLLGLAHARSAARSDLAQLFSDVTYFHELRIEPFFLRVADRVPSLADAIREVAGGMLSRRSALVHGDYSPKNILADGGDIVILDFEVTHWGDPRFDLGFCISHLLLKAHRAGADHEAILHTIQSFISAYRTHGQPVIDEDLTRITACLLLARFEGSSPVDYAHEIDARRVRHLAESMLRAARPAVLDHLDKNLELI